MRIGCTEVTGFPEDSLAAIATPCYTDCYTSWRNDCAFQNSIAAAAERGGPITSLLAVSHGRYILSCSFALTHAAPDRTVAILDLKTTVKVEARLTRAGLKR